MKVTVEQFLNAGFELVIGGDVISNGAVSGKWNSIDSKLFDQNPSKYDGYFVKSLAPRPNLGTQPVADDCVVEIEYRNGVIRDISAASRSWDESGTTYSIKSCKPSLKHLEQQMNDNQESAMNISERDIENAFIKQEDVEVERELSEIGEWVNGDTVCYYNKQLQEGGNLIYVSQHPTHSDHSVVFASEEVIPFFTVPTSMLSKPLTPEQLAEKEREMSIDQMWLDTIVGDYDEVNRDSRAWHHCSRIYDAGYRK